MFGWVKRALKKAFEKVKAEGENTIRDVGNSILYLVMLALILVGIGIGASAFLGTANVSNPSSLPIVGQVFGGISKGLNMAAVAIVVGFVAVIIAVLAGVWKSFRNTGMYQ